MLSTERLPILRVNLAHEERALLQNALSAWTSAGRAAHLLRAAALHHGPWSVQTLSGQLAFAAFSEPQGADEEEGEGATQEEKEGEKQIDAKRRQTLSMPMVCRFMSTALSMVFWCFANGQRCGPTPWAWANGSSELITKL